MSGAPVVVVVGTGGFATAFCRALLTSAREPMRLIVLGGGEAALLRLRKAVGETTNEVLPVRVDLVPDTDFTPLLRAARPDLVVVAAAPQPPRGRTGDRWSKLADATPFGLTTLLRAPLAVRIAESAKHLNIPVVNASYPDVVNPMLAALGLPVLFGLGNAHTLTTGLRTPVPLLAHHRQLDRVDPGDDVRVLAGDAVATLGNLATFRRKPRHEMDDAGAAAGGTLVARVLAGETVDTNLPGPNGLPGGYPVTVDRFSCVLRLPDTTPVEHAVAWNRSHSAAEGVTVSPDGVLVFEGPTATALDQLGIAPRVACDEWERAARRLHAARRRLSAIPA